MLELQQGRQSFAEPSELSQGESGCISFESIHPCMEIWSALVDRFSVGKVYYLGCW